jgi:hypothetical protein
VVALVYIRIISVVTFVLIANYGNVDYILGINSDLVKILHMALFSFTNGYGSTLAACLTPTLVEGEDK